MKNPDTLGIYLHIPFCLKKCLYCDFCSFPVEGDKDVREAYCRELCRRMRNARALCSDRTVDTVYIGGGTPTLLPADCFSMLFDTLRESFSLSPDCEISCECNPATADGVLLGHIRTLGVNRLSIGLQSMHANELAALGRLHSTADFLSVFSTARKVGFDNISVDLMYGIPEQSPESFSATLDAVCALSPEHVSAYGLKIEENTPFFLRRNTLPLPDEDAEFSMYRLCTDKLAAAGYAKYEISNFAKPGRECRHNLRYWQEEEYLGFGVAAHSCFGGERFGNSRDLAAFLAGEDITAERHRVGGEERRRIGHARPAPDKGRGPFPFPTGHRRGLFQAVSRRETVRPVGLYDRTGGAHLLYRQRLFRQQYHPFGNAYAFMIRISCRKSGQLP